MILDDLIKQTEWLSVEFIILELYPDIKESIEAHKIAFEKIKQLEPNMVDMEIVLAECQDDFEDEIETYVDVSGKKINTKNSQSYALEFMSWKDWLGMQISKDSLINFNELEIIAHCIYEMTFIDFDEEEIENQKNTLTSIVDDFQNLSEEEKQEKTISIEDIIKRLDGDNK